MKKLLCLVICLLVMFTLTSCNFPKINFGGFTFSDIIPERLLELFGIYEPTPVPPPSGGNTTPIIHPHLEGNTVIENEIAPTCITKGSYDEVLYCVSCGEEMSRTHKETNTISHQESGWITDIEATCSSEGKAHKECTVCSEILYEQTTSKADHKLDNIAMEDEYCGDRQVSSIYCSVCGEYVTSYGHHYIKTVIPASCTEDGEIRYTCDICNDTYFNVIPASGHIESEYKTVYEASCTNGGSAVKSCIICDEIVKTVELSKKDHSYATSSSNNKIIYTCTNCGDNFAEDVENSIFTVTFTSDEVLLNTISVEEGTSISLFPNVTKDGYHLAYWAINDGANTPYEDQCIYEDTNLIAVWEKEEILKAEYSDIAVFPQADVDFTFKVNAKSETDVRNALSIFNVNDENISYNVRYISNGVYEVYSSNYQPGEFYYALAGEGISFVGTESREIQFSTKGENNVVVEISDSVKWLEYSNVYGVIEAKGAMLLLTEEVLNVGDDVAIYEDTQDNIVLVIKILTKGEMLGYNAYGFEVGDYDKVFEKLEANVSGDLSDGVLSIDPAAVEAIENEFKSSALYKKAKRAAKELASQYGITISGENIKTTIASKDGYLILTLEVKFEFEDNWSIIVSYKNKIDIGFDYHINGFKKSSFIVTTTQYENIQFRLSYVENEQPQGSSAKEAYSKMMDKYKEIFDRLDNKDFFDKSSNPKHESLDHISLGQIDLTIYFVVVSIDVYLDFDFEINASCGINVETTTTTTNGIRNGRLVCSRDFEITGANMFIHGKLRAACLVKIEVFAHIAGAGVFANAGVGPYFEIGGAGSMGYDGHNMYMSKFSMYFDAGIRVEANVGIKYELFDYTAFKEEFELIGKDFSFPGFPLGSKEIWLAFRSYEESVTINGACDTTTNVDISEIVDVYIKYQNLDDMFLDYKIPDNIGYSIISISGYRSKVSLIDNKLCLDKIGEDITIEIKIRVTDTIYKSVYINYKPKHANNCVHMTCAKGSHIGGMATCTERAICERCDLEYGEMPVGHIMQNEKCTVCGYMVPSEGLEYIMLNNATYSVVGIGTFTGSILVIPSEYDGFPVTTIGDRAFKQCSTITKVIIPDSVTDIGEWAFTDCDDLSKVIIGNSVKSIGNRAFTDCTRIVSVTIPDSVTNIGDFAFSHTNITSVTIPNGVTSINYGAFYYCRSLTNVTIPSSVTSIGENAFGFCDSLYLINNNSNIRFEFGSSNYGLIAQYAKVIINNGTQSYINEPKNQYILTDYNFLFKYDGNKYTLIAYCGDKETIELPESINGTNYEIYYMRGVIDVTIPDTIINIGDRAFYECTSLNSITISDSVTNIGERAFYSCYNLSNIKIGNNVESIGDCAFTYCERITSVTIPNTVTSIGKGAFLWCRRLKSIAVDDNNKYYKSINGNLYTKDGKILIQYAIGKTDALFEIPDGVTEIGFAAFGACLKLSNILIPNSVISIGNNAFYNDFYYCEDITSVYYEGTASDWSEIPVGGYNSRLTDATRYYYSETEPTVGGNYWHYDENGEIAVW